jgi:hypothetical protein
MPPATWRASASAASLPLSTNSPHGICRTVCRHEAHYRPVGQVSRDGHPTLLAVLRQERGRELGEAWPGSAASSFDLYSTRRRRHRRAATPAVRSGVSAMAHARSPTVRQARPLCRPA